MTTCHVLIILLLVFCQIKCLGFFNSNVIHWINRSVSGTSERLTYKASDNTISCKMVFNLRFLFVLFVPSEMTAFRNGITHSPPPHPRLLSCLWVDMLLWRHLLASIEGQDLQYKLSNGTHTSNLASAFRFIHTQWMSGI